MNMNEAILDLKLFLSTFLFLLHAMWNISDLNMPPKLFSVILYFFIHSGQPACLNVLI